MTHKTSVIELNGKKYDAKSGKILSDVVHHSSPKPVVQPAKHPRTGTNVDGFVRNQVVHPKTTAASTSSKPIQKPATEVNHHARKTQATKTLMRHAVKKPGVSKAAPFSGLSTPLDVSTTRIASPQVIQTQRNKKAETTAQSPLISRFGQTAMPSVSKKTVHLPVTPAPSHASVHTASVKKTVAAPHDASAQAKAQAQSQSQSQKNIASALDKASSHTHGKLKATKRRHKAAHKLGVSPRFLSGAAATMAIVLLVGFFAYQNVPSIAVRMAASKAGFSAKLPGYQPSGFAMSGPVQAGPGIVTISFASNSDDRSFQLSQRPSEWNSESLLNQFVAQKNTPYRTVQEAGKTIYMYNESSATWVSGGVWYQIDGESDLSSEQLLRIANSI